MLHTVQATPLVVEPTLIDSFLSLAIHSHETLPGRVGECTNTRDQGQSLGVRGSKPIVACHSVPGSVRRLRILDSTFDTADR